MAERCRHPKLPPVCSNGDTSWPEIALRGMWLQLDAWCPRCGAVRVWWTNNRRRWIRPAGGKSDD